jgi:hypothetical protein
MICGPHQHLRVRHGAELLKPTHSLALGICQPEGGEKLL